MKRRIPELVAPAGSLTTFSAGLESGADAFYFGIGRFNARARAQNIEIEKLETLVSAAREAGRKLYLAINILVRDQEIQDVVRILERVETFGVDAVIIQDLGLLYLIRRFFPSLALHASTQMFLHNSLQMEALVRRGVTRVILPRELRLEEIREIRKRLSVEMEVFVHGALCFSFSGLCLASSHLLGASGNRGVCKQVCRFAVEGDAARYPFSMKDLEGRTHLEALLEMGIESFKIEGRLRNADYVREVVTYYRRCLDQWSDGKSLPSPPSRWRYGRETTSGHLTSQPYERMVFADREPWIGESVGDVKSVSRGKARLAFHKKVFPGDRLRILKEDGVKVHEFTLLEGTGDRNEVEVEVPDRSRARVRWKVYRLGTSRTPSARSIQGKPGRLKNCPVDLFIHYAKGMLGIEAFPRGREHFRASFPLQSQTGMNPLDAVRVQACFSRADKTPFRMGQIRAALEDPLAVPVRELNRVRREFFHALEGFHDKEILRERERRRQEILEFFEAVAHEDLGQEETAVLEVVPYEEFNRDSAVPGSGEILWLELPLFVSETRLQSFLRELNDLANETGVGFVCHSLGWVDYLKGRAGQGRIASGGYLYCMNRFAYRFLSEAGASRILLSSDFPKEDRRWLLRFRKTAMEREPVLRLFVARLRLPGRSYRLKRWNLLAVPRKEYTEVVLWAEEARPESRDRLPGVRFQA